MSTASDSHQEPETLRPVGNACDTIALFARSCWAAIPAEARLALGLLVAMGCTLAIPSSSHDRTALAFFSATQLFLGYAFHRTLTHPVVTNPHWLLAIAGAMGMCIPAHVETAADVCSLEENGWNCFCVLAYTVAVTIGYLLVVAVAIKHMGELILLPAVKWASEPLTRARTLPKIE